MSKLSATILICAGAALVGLIAGWDVAPLTLELGRTELAAACAVVCLILGVTGCRMASERAEARARKQRQLDSFTRLGLLLARSIRDDLGSRREQASNGSGAQNTNV
jgi:hypothetical protein